MVKTNKIIGKTNNSVGRLVENMAINFLSGMNYRILKQRYKSQYGEIDIICRKGKKIIFIEVKGRKAQNTDLNNIISNQQFHRIHNAAIDFIAQNSIYQEHEWQFDIIIIQLPELQINHIQNVQE